MAGARAERAEASYSADLFSLSKSASFGREAEIHAAAGGYGEAEFSLRRGFKMNAGLGAFAGAGGSVRKFAAASLDVKAMAHAEIQAQAQFPLDFFSESGAVCRLSVGASAGIYGSLSVGLALEDFRRAFLGAQTGIALRLGEIFLDEVTIEAGVWAKAAIAAQASVKCVVAGSLLPDPRGRRKPGFTASFEWGLGLLYGTGLSAFAKLGFRDPSRLVARTADELTAVVLELVEQHAGRSAAEAVPYVRMLLPLALRSCYELGVVAVKEKGAAAKREARERLAAIAREEATAFASELLFADGLRRMRRLFDDPKTTQAVSRLTGEAAARARKALEEFQAALPRRPSLTNVPRLVDPFLEFVSLVRPENAGAWTDAAATVWAALATLARARAADGAKAAVPDSGARVRGHVNRTIGRPSGAPVDASTAARFLVERRALDAAASRPEVRSAIGWLRTLFPGSAPITEVLFAPGPGSLTEATWVALRDGLRQAARDKLEPEVASLLGGVGEGATKEFITEVVRPALLSLGEVILDGVDTLGSAEGRLVFREQVSLLLLQVIGRNAVACGDIVIATALSQAARGMRSLAGTLRGKGNDAFLRFAETALKLTGRRSPRDQLVGILEFGASLAELWDDNERRKLRTNLLAMMDLVGARRNPRAVWRDVARDKQFLPNLKALKAFVAGTAIQLGRLILRAIWLYLKHLVDDVIEMVTAIARDLWEAGKKFVRALESVVRTLRNEIRKLVDAIRHLDRTIKELGREVRRQVAAIKKRLRSRAFREQAVRALRRLGEEGLLHLVRAHPAYKILPTKALKRKAQSLARSAYRGVFDTVFAPLVRAALDAVGAVSALIPERVGVGPEAAPARIEAAVTREASEAIRRVLSRRTRLSVGIKVWGKRIGITLPLPVDAMTRSLAHAVGADGAVQAALRASAGLRKRNAAASHDLQATRARERSREADLRQAEQRLPSVGADQVRVALTSPGDGSVVSGDALLEGVVRGADETFVRPGRNGARRVQAVLDGRPIAFRSDDWRWHAARRELHFRHRLPRGPKAAGHTFTVVATDGRNRPVSATVAFGVV